MTGIQASRPCSSRPPTPADPVLKKTPSAFTIHNLGYQGLFPRDAMFRAGLGQELFTMERLEFYGRVNFLKGGLIYSDAITNRERGIRQGKSRHPNTVSVWKECFRKGPLDCAAS